VIAVDTNVLVYAHREELPQHEQALAWLTALAEGASPWGIPVFCLGEFVRVITHSRVFDPPSTLVQAVAAIESLLACPSLRVLSPGPDYPRHFLECAREADARGNLAFDAQIVATCREHGCTGLLTLDRDFDRFRKFKTISINDPPP
jgi:toxin-antitoxin system PIN domain toxin